MKSDRDIEKMVSRLEVGLNRKEQKEVVQYSRGLQDGMRIAYLAVARRLLASGQPEEAVLGLLEPFMKKAELRELLAEAKDFDR